MKKLFLLLLLLLSSCIPKNIFTLYGIEVQNSECLSEQMKINYREASLPLPLVLQRLLSEIIVFENTETEELSGFTQTQSIHGEWVASTIYLSSTHFQVETLIHEALHIYDAKMKISSSLSFRYIMNEEMSRKTNPRIYKFYESSDYPSEYFVESMLSHLSHSMQFQMNQPLTFHYLKKYALELKD